MVVGTSLELEIPLKTKIFLWLALANNILTSDYCQKRNWKGPSWWIMCKDSSESMDHVFVHCPFTNFVWKDVLQFLKPTFS